MTSLSNSYNHATGYYDFVDDDATTAPYDPDAASQLSYHSHSTFNTINSPLHISPVLSTNSNLDNPSTASYRSFEPVFSTESSLIIDLGHDDDAFGALSRAGSSPPPSPQPNPFRSPVPLSPVPLSPVPLSPVPLSPVPLSPIPLSPVPLSPVPLSPVPLSPVLPLSPIPQQQHHHSPQQQHQSPPPQHQAAPTTPLFAPAPLFPPLGVPSNEEEEDDDDAMDTDEPMDIDEWCEEEDSDEMYVDWVGPAPAFPWWC